MCVCVCKFVYVCVYVCICVYVCMYMYVCMYVSTIHNRTAILPTYGFKGGRFKEQIGAISSFTGPSNCVPPLYTHTHTYTYTHIHTHTQTHTYTYKRAIRLDRIIVCAHFVRMFGCTRLCSAINTLAAQPSPSGPAVFIRHLPLRTKLR